MIRNVAPDSRDFQQLFGHPCMAAAIGGRASCPQPGSDFWVVEQEGCPRAFLCRIGGGAYITGDPACGEEIREFLPLLGYCQLLTDLSLEAAGTTIQLLAMEQTEPPPLWSCPGCSFPPSLAVFR